MGLDVRENVPLAPFTTLGVGGPARYYTRAHGEEDLRAALRFARERGLPFFVLGGGSNLVLADEGHPGLVVHLALRGVEARERDGHVEIVAAAGEPWDELVAHAVARGWAGLECLSGIPGLVGATPIQNVGAYGQEVCETITAVAALDLATGERVTLSNPECGFSYRMSRFKSGDAGRYVVVEVAFRLHPGGAPAVRYAELQRYLSEHGPAAPALRDVRDAVLALRRRKSMVLDPGDPNTRSVGSFFMNPVVDGAEYERVEGQARRSGALAADATMPHFPTADGRVKVSAAWLIEKSGLGKGYGVGRVGLSANHTLAVVNRGGATAAEVVAFAREVRARVRDRFGVTLHPEPVFVGVTM